MFTQSVLFALLLCTFLQGGAMIPVKEKPFYDLDKGLDYFLDFVKTYNKVYEFGEANEKFTIFVKNLELINKRNKVDMAIHRVHPFADMSSEEFGKKMLTAKLPDPSFNATPVSVPDKSFKAPDSFDWRDHNAVTPIKNQGNCGSCWTFSAVATIEGQYAIKKQSLQQFSEQQIMDCDTDPNDNGCDGGQPVGAFTYIAQSDGLETESDYAYVGAKGQCSAQADKAVVKLTNPQSSPMSEEDMASKIASYGPISVVIRALGLVSVTDGIFTGTECTDACVNLQTNETYWHAITAIGYGNDESPYWLMKNSWGTTLNNQGYFKMLRGSGICQITSMISTVDVV